MFLKCYWTGESISSLPSTYGNACLLSVVDLLEIVSFGELQSVSNCEAVECQMRHLFCYCSGNNLEFSTSSTYFWYFCSLFLVILLVMLRQRFTPASAQSVPRYCYKCPSHYRGYCGHWCPHMQQVEAA